jgi:hypothetical protein
MGCPRICTCGSPKLQTIAESSDSSVHLERCLSVRKWRHAAPVEAFRVPRCRAPPFPPRPYPRKPGLATAAHCSHREMPPASPCGLGPSLLGSLAPILVRMERGSCDRAAGDGHSLSYSQSITHSDDISLSVSVLGANNPGSSLGYTPTCSIAWTHQLRHVPDYFAPERHGTVTGIVFQDEQSKGVWDRDMKPIPKVEVVLDDRQRTITSPDGSYRFDGVTRGKHRIAAVYRSPDPFFFTTASELEVDEDATVNFGIGHTLSGLMGRVMDDAGRGASGITLLMTSRGSKWSTATDAGRSFLVSSLIAGDYDVRLDEDSLPAGYSTQGLIEPQQVTVAAASPGNAVHRTSISLRFRTSVKL